MTIYRLDPDKTPDDYRAEANERNRSAEESFDRSDTDGFLSQWANNQMANVYETLATLAENGGVHDFLQLQYLDGTPVPGAKVIRGKFGLCWLIPGTQVTFAPFRPVHVSTLIRRGYREGTVSLPAAVETYETGGLNLGIRYIPDNQRVPLEQRS